VNALFLAPEAPYPLTGGGPLRSASLLHYLARGHHVDVILFRQPGAPDPAAALPPGLVQRSIVLDLPVNRRTAAAKMWRNAHRLVRQTPPLIDRFSGFETAIERFLSGRQYEVAIVEHFWCAPNADTIAPHARRTLLDLHNIESILHERCAATESGPAAVAHRIFARACGDLERIWLSRYSGLLVTSEVDAARVREIAPGVPTTIYPNTIPTRPAPLRQEEEVIVFSGNLEYHPNISAVRWFRQEIWPILRQRWPHLKWRLVGKNPEAVLRYTTGDSRIETTGAVEDAVIELARAKVAVVPLLAGSGTRFKILEAWAAGTPIVSTALGAEGLPVQTGENILLADSPGAFADAVSRLLESAEDRRRMAMAGRMLFEQEFTWEAAWKKLEEEAKEAKRTGSQGSQKPRKPECPQL
jgi:glycosyltransferase involved in cell wall biosynthesis